MEPSTAFWRTLPGRRSLLTLLGRVWKSDNNGSALVEMAVVLPLMLVLITGMMSMGIVLNNYLVLSHASDIGARYLALNQGSFANTAAGNPCIMAAQQIQAASTAIPAGSISYEIGLTTAPPSPTTTWYGSSSGLRKLCVSLRLRRNRNNRRGKSAIWWNRHGVGTVPGDPHYHFLGPSHHQYGGHNYRNHSVSTCRISAN